MARPLILAAVLFAVLTSSARAAEDIMRVGPGAFIDDVLPSADGGAWFVVERPDGDSVVRVRPDRTLVTTPLGRDSFGRGTVAPDGRAWWRVEPDRIARIDTEGRLSWLGPYGFLSLGFALVPGPDGSVWTTSNRPAPHLPDPTRSVLVRLTADGPDWTDLDVPGCEALSGVTEMAAAGDGTVWLTDPLCRRFVHLSAQGTPTSFDADGAEPLFLAGDAAGGLWFTSLGTRTGGHVDAAGQVSFVAVPKSRGALGNVAVAPDGSAWFASGRCSLARVTPAGVETRPAPVPVTDVAFDPAGGLWLGNGRRLVHTTVDQLSAAGCDGRPARALGTPRGRITLAALRRNGVRVRTDEPASMRVDAIYRFGGREQLMHAGGHDGAFRYRVNARRLRRMERELAAGQRVELRLGVVTIDAEGNFGQTLLRWRVTR